MTFLDYQLEARRTQNPKLMQAQRKLHALHGIAAECGEIHALYQKIYQGHDLTTERIIDELGDLLWFIAELCDCCYLNLEQVATNNIDKLRARYPEGFDAERSLHREGEKACG